MIEWILEKLPVIIFVVIFIGQMVRGLMKAKDTEAEPPVSHNELEEQRRTEEIQREIRRKIAARRGGAMPAGEAAEAPPVMRRDPTAIPLPEPLGGPLRKLFEELERRAEPVAAPVAPPPLAAERRNEELERQQRLADELAALKARRAAQTAAAKAEAAAPGRRAAAAGGRSAVEELKDPERLRRAFLQREILGPPVSLRP